MTTRHPPKTITLVHPIEQGDHPITEIVLNAPDTGSLRGLSLVEALRADTETTLTLIERCGQPRLTKPQLAELSLPDLVELSMALIGFFGPSKDSQSA